jgi:thiamine-phosphate pyrophosphorylase
MAMRTRHAKNLPALWLVTDERVAPDALLKAAERLPKGRGGVLFRHHASSARERRRLFQQFITIARRRRLTLLLAGNARQAAAWGADGWHGREPARAARPMAHSMAVHDARELQVAQRAAADMIFLSPLFPTRSHPGERALGRLRFAALAHRATMPVMALGGVGARHGTLLQGIGAAGWAAIDGLTK